MSCSEEFHSKYILSGDSKGTIKLWDIESKKCIRTKICHNGEIKCLLVLNDERFASCSKDTTIKIWDIQSGDCLKTLQGHTDTVNGLVVLNDGRLVSCSDDKTIKFWNINASDPCIVSLFEEELFRCLTFLYDDFLVSGCNKDHLRVWDTKYCYCKRCLYLTDQRYRRDNLNDRSVRCLTVLRDGTLVSGSANGTIRLWSKQLYMYQLECTKTINTKINEIKCLVGLDDKFFASCHDGNNINILNTENETLQSLEGHTDVVNSLAILNNGQLVSGGKDMTIKIWNTQNRECLSTIEGHTEAVFCFTILSNGDLVSSSADDSIKIWNPDNAECRTTIRKCAFAIYCLVCLNENCIVSAGADSKITLWDIKSGKRVKNLSGQSGAVYCLAVLDNGFLASGSMDSTIKIWDTLNDTCILTLMDHTYSVRCLMDLNDSGLVSGSVDRTIKIWNTENGECLITLEGHADTVNCLAILDKSHLFSGSSDGSVKQWNIDDKQCIRTFEGHNGEVFCLVVLKNGNIASGGSDKIVKVWNTLSETCIRDLKGHFDSITCLSVLNNGNLVSGSWDKTIKFWNIQNGECIRSLEGPNDSVVCLAVLNNPSSKINECKNMQYDEADNEKINLDHRLRFNEQDKNLDEWLKMRRNTLLNLKMITELLQEKSKNVELNDREFFTLQIKDFLNEIEMKILNDEKKTSLFINTLKVYFDVKTSYFKEFDDLYLSFQLRRNRQSTLNNDSGFSSSLNNDVDSMIPIAGLSGTVGLFIKHFKNSSFFSRSDSENLEPVEYFKSNIKERKYNVILDFVNNLNEYYDILKKWKYARKCTIREYENIFDALYFKSKVASNMKLNHIEIETCVTEAREAAKTEAIYLKKLSENIRILSCSERLKKDFYRSIFISRACPSDIFNISSIFYFKKCEAKSLNKDLESMENYVFKALHSIYE